MRCTRRLNLLAGLLCSHTNGMWRSVVYTLPMMHWASSYTTTHRRTLHGGYHKHGW